MLPIILSILVRFLSKCYLHQCQKFLPALEKDFQAAMSQYPILINEQLLANVLVEIVSKL